MKTEWISRMSSKVCKNIACATGNKTYMTDNHDFQHNRKSHSHPISVKEHYIMISQFDCWVWSMDGVLVKVPGCSYLWLFVGLMASGCSPGCCCCSQGANCQCT